MKTCRKEKKHLVRLGKKLNFHILEFFRNFIKIQRIPKKEKKISIVI